MNAKAKFAALSMLAAAVSLVACDQVGVEAKYTSQVYAEQGMEFGNPDPYVKFTEALILSLQDSAEIAPKSEPALDPERETCTCTSAEFPEYNNLPQCFYIASAQGASEGSGNTFISCT